MNRSHAVATCAALLLVMGLLGWRTGAAADSTTSELLTGELWQKMSLDSKVAFVWGVSQVVDFERNLDATEERPDLTWPPKPGQKSILPYLIKGLSGKPISEVVRQVDTYYTTHPDQLQRPVVDTIVKAVALPTLETK